VRGETQHLRAGLVCWVSSLDPAYPIKFYDFVFRDDKLRAWYFRYFPAETQRRRDAETRRNPLCVSARKNTDKPMIYHPEKFSYQQTTIH